MSFWDDIDYGFAGSSYSRRRDVSKFGISPPKRAGENGRLYIPAHLRAKVGQYVRYVETPEGMAFKIGDRGDYKIRPQNSTSDILIAQAPFGLCRFAKDRAISVEVEDFNGGYLCRYSQFTK